MKVIFKYTLNVTDKQVIQMPVGAEILKVDTQYNKICIWAMFDRVKEYDTEERVFEIFGTGNSFEESDKRNYLDTIQLYDGEQIYHVFEINLNKSY